MKQEIYYVTTNIGKLAEVAEYIDNNMPQLAVKQYAFDVDEIQSDDQIAIAIDKAKKAWSLLKKPLLVDDAGIYFEKYHKFPGTMSKFVIKGLGFEGIKQIIDEGDRAYYQLTMIYIEEEDQAHVFQGRCDGSLTKPEQFTGDPFLPYDVFFIANGEKVTNAVLRDDIKNHQDAFYRIKALKQFVAWYQKRYV